MTDKPPFLRRDPLRLGAMDRIAEHFRERQRSLLAVDEAVEAIVRALHDQGELDDTYILFTSDNGYMQGEHDVPSGKMLPYEPSTRVPLLLRGPGIPAGRVSRELVGNIDLAPTILKAARARPGKVIDGRSLLRFARHPRLRSRRPFLHETGGLRFIPVRDQDQDGTPAVRRILSYAPSAPDAGSTSSTAGAGASCTTSRATPASSTPTSPTLATRASAACFARCCIVWRRVAARPAGAPRPPSPHCGAHRRFI